MLPFPPTVNTYYRRHGHIIHISSKGAKYRKTVAAIVGKRKPLTGRVSLHIRVYPPDKRKRDIDNLLKPFIDSLTHAGMWVDDSQIDDLRIVRYPVLPLGQVEVEIKELK